MRCGLVDPELEKRLHHTCTCPPNLSCITIEEGKSKCLSPYKCPDYYLRGRLVIFIYLLIYFE